MVEQVGVSYGGGSEPFMDAIYPIVQLIIG